MHSKLKYVITFCYLLLIWLFPIIPLNDLQNHLDSINIIDQVYKGDPYLSEIFKVDLFKPAIAPHLIILFFMQFFHITVASKIFLTIYILLFLFSMNLFFKTFSLESNKELLVLVSLLFIFNHFFHLGLLGFFLSMPVFFILFTYWYNYKSNYYLLAFSLFFLLFFHIIASCLFLLAVLFFNRGYLKKFEFYLSLTPFILVLLIWFLNSSLAEGQTWEVYLQDFFSYEVLLHQIYYKIYWSLAFSPVGMTIILIISLYFLISKSFFDLNNKFFQFSLFLLSLVILLPEYVPNWWLVSNRFLLFFFPFYMLMFPKIPKIDKNLIIPVIFIFNVMLLGFNFYLFYDFDQDIQSFITMKDYIEPNSSIQYIFSPSRLKVTLSVVEPYLHLHHYLALHTPSVHAEDTFTYWYNPLEEKEELLSGFHYINVHLGDDLFEDINNCEEYILYYRDLINDERYPQYDYVVIYTDECNTTDYFIDEYEIISDGDFILMQLKTDNS